MRVTCMLTISVNGYIARLDGQEDFLSHENWDEFLDAAHAAGNFVIGRNTYDTVTRLYDGFGFDDVDAGEKIIVTRNAVWPVPPGYRSVSSPQAAVDSLAARGAAQLLLVGGAGLNSSFARAHLIDEVVLTVEPVVLGEGVNVFATGMPDLRLTPTGTEPLSNGRLRVSYAVASPHS